MSFQSLLTDSVNVERAVVATDEIGGQSCSWTVVETAIKCRISEISADRRYISGSTGIEITHKMSCRASADIEETDEVIYGSKRLQVVSVLRAPSGSGTHHYVIELQEIRNGGR